MFDIIRSDLQKKRDMSRTDIGRSGMCCTFFERGSIAVMVYRFGRWARQVRVPVMGLLLKALYYVSFYLVQMFTGISIQAHAEVGRRFVVRNYSCIFVLAEKIGDDFTVCEGVTVGNIRGRPRLAIIGNNVYLEPGAKVLGDVTIGDNVVVRANSLVVSDVPSNSIVTGIPGRISPLSEPTTSSNA
jgi:serine O-acetyltransferase